MSWPLLQNSLWVASLATFLAVGLGFLAAVFLASLGRRCRHVLILASVAALAMPPFLTTNAWLDLLGAAGLLRAWLPLNVYSLTGVVMILSLMLWPIPMLLALAALRRVESSHLEAEPVLRGCTLAHWLLWPAVRRGLGLAAALVFVLALNNFAVPAILQVKVQPAEVWISFNTHLDSWEALRLGWPLLVAPLLPILLLIRMGEIRWPHLDSDLPAGLLRRRLGAVWFAGVALLTAALVVLSVFLPLAQLVLSRRTWTELWPALAAGGNAVARSGTMAAFTATVTVLCAALALSRRAGILGAAGVCRKPGLFRLGYAAETELPTSTTQPTQQAVWWWRAVEVAGASLIWLPFFLPGIFLGLGLIWLCNRPGWLWFYQGSGVMLLALGIRYLAPAWFSASAAYRGLDPGLLDAGRLEGACGWALFRCAVWPQAGSQLAAAWYVVYILCLWDVETLVLILPPGGETLAMRVFNLLHYGHSGQVNALCLWLLALAVLPLALWRMGRLLLRTTDSTQRPLSGGMASAFPGVVCLILALLVTGCAPGSSPKSTALESTIFGSIEIVGSRGAGVGEFNKPRSVAVDAADNLYVVDMTGRVQKFSPQGRYLLSWQMPQTDLGKPKGMCRDGQGNIVVVEPHYQRINHFSPEGRVVAQWGGHLTNGGPFSLPRAVAVNSRSQAIVSEYTLAERIQVFDSSRKRLFEIGRSGLGPGEFNRPEGVGVDAADRIYVADSCNHRIQVFSPEGRFLKAYGRAGTAHGQFSYPYDIQVDSAGRQYVCEFGNSRIQVFDVDGKFVEAIGRPGAAPGQFANPWGLALDSKGNLYVADSMNNRVQKLVRRVGSVPDK